MTRTRSLPMRALGGALSLSLALAGLGVVAAPAAAATAVVYDSIPEAQPPAYPSLGFAATSTTEFGDYVLLGGSNRVVSQVTIGFTSWACESGAWNTADCVSAPGATFDHPITVTLYEASLVAGEPVAGDVIATVTELQALPYRPSTDSENCVGGRWRDAASGICSNGFATDLTFDFTAAAPITGNDVIVGVAFDTQNHGESPIGVPGPYDSLNVSLASEAPIVGVDEDVDEMMWATTYPGYDGSWSVDTGWSDVNGLVMEIVADSVPAIDPLTDITVYERDVKANETADTYTSWHEGNPNVSLDNSVVLEDGLHLGVGHPSTVIKGTDVPNSIVTRAELRTLISRASVVVESGLVTYQVPVFFGPADAPTFTTLRSTSLAAGTHTVGQSDIWATSRAFGDYAAQQEAPLGELIDALYATGGVALAGYGVQADSAAVVSSFVWDDTRYTFVQPVIEACTPTAGDDVTNLQLAEWSFGETRALGANQFVEGGLRVTTFLDESDPANVGSPDQRKAAGYHPIDIALSEVGVAAIEIEPGFTGVRPGLQLGLDVDGDGDWDGYLVGEPWAYGGGDWSSTVNGDWADANFWSSKDFGVGAGSGYPSMGTLDEYLLANPEARLVNYGYSLGSGVLGDAVISSITVGCVTTAFALELETLAPPTTERLAGADRYATAVAISQYGHLDGGPETVYIATGAGYADALSAAPAAASADAPLLLTLPNSLPAIVATELERLAPAEIVVVGGEGVVSAAVFAALEDLTFAPNVRRVFGADRYETSRAIARDAFGTATSAYIATGVNFPDALAAGPAASAFGGPVVLVPGSNAALDAATLDLLDELEVTDVRIAGGTGVVSDGIAVQLEALYTVTRNAGADRYATAIAINEDAFTSETRVFLATGEGYADALTGAAMAAFFGNPLYVSPTACLPAATLASIEGLSATSLVLLGGTGVLSVAVENLDLCGGGAI